MAATVIRMAARPQSDGSTDRAGRDVIHFGSYEVHLRAGELFRAGRKIKLQIQPFQVLAMLLERPGEVVAREELHKRLWPSDTFVDFDHSLNTAVKKLRQALSDDKNKPRFIETLPKRGYRFIGTCKQNPFEQNPFDQNEPPILSEKIAKPLPSALPPARPPVPPRAGNASPSPIGRIAKISTEGKANFALVCADEASAAERDKLDAANDDVGLSLLIAAQKMFLVPGSTPVRILDIHEASTHCLVRILDGEHYGKTAIVSFHSLTEFA